MPVDLFLVLPPTNLPTGPVTADPTVDPYFKTTFANQPVVEIRSLSLGVENVTTIGSATTGAGAGKMKFNQAYIEKPVDTLSRSLFQISASGAHLAKMQVFVRKSGIANAKPYLVYGFAMVFVDKIDWSVSDGDEQPVEQVTFAYGQLALGYYPQKPDGTFATPTSARAGWNQVTNTDKLDTDVFTNF